MSRPTRAGSPHRDGLRVEGTWAASRQAGPGFDRTQVSRIACRKVQSLMSRVRVAGCAGSRQVFQCLSALSLATGGMFSGQPRGPRRGIAGCWTKPEEPVGQKIDGFLGHSETQMPLVQPTDVRPVLCAAHGSTGAPPACPDVHIRALLLMKRCALPPLSHLGVAQQPPTKVHSACMW